MAMSGNKDLFPSGVQKQFQMFSGRDTLNTLKGPYEIAW